MNKIPITVSLVTIILIALGMVFYTGKEEGYKQCKTEIQRDEFIETCSGLPRTYDECEILWLEKQRQKP